jgi:hypothetical protein
MEWVHTLKHLRLPSLRLPIARKDVGLSERSYVQAEPPQTLPPVPDAINFLGLLHLVTDSRFDLIGPS